MSFGFGSIYLHEVILGQIGNVCMLNMRDIRGLEKSDIHDCSAARCPGIESQSQGC